MMRMIFGCFGFWENNGAACRSAASMSDDVFMLFELLND